VFYTQQVIMCCITAAPPYCWRFSLLGPKIA
jgi:hypothetical protein